MLKEVTITRLMRFIRGVRCSGESNVLIGRISQTRWIVRSDLGGNICARHEERQGQRMSSFGLRVSVDGSFL